MLPTEPIGSIPRPLQLSEAIEQYGDDDARHVSLCDEAVRDTVTQFEATGSPVITDGEQRKYQNYWTYCVQGMPNVVNPIDPHVETPEAIRDRILEAADYIPIEQLGTTDDCGFSPFCDDRSTSRATAFAKIRARVTCIALASEILGVSE